MKNIKFNLLKFGLLALGLAFFSCEKDDYTNDSILEPNSTNVSITTPFSQTTLVEDNSVYNVEVNLSSPQVVDVKVYLSVISGTATEGDDFTIDHEIVISAGSTKGFAKITVLQDDFFEDTENFKIQVGNSLTANADISSFKTIDFTILNYTEGDLAIDLSWDPIAYDQNADAINPTAIADMILKIYNPDGSLLDEIDGGSFESYVLSGSLPDGLYTVKVAYYEARQFDDPVDVPLSLDFFQTGVFENSFEYKDFTSTPDALLCYMSLTLATIQKSGTSYELTSTPSKLFDIDLADFDGGYSGEDGVSSALYDSTVTISASGTLIEGLNTGWMVDWWGETITSSNPVTIVINYDGTIEIPLQPYIVTDYKGNAYEYSISGSGTYNSCDPKKLHIEYDMYNVTDDYSVGEWLKANKYSTTDYFIAEISL